MLSLDDVRTYKVDNEAAVGAAAGGMAEECFAIGEFSDDREFEGSGE